MPGDMYSPRLQSEQVERRRAQPLVAEQEAELPLKA